MGRFNLNSSRNPNLRTKAHKSLMRKRMEYKGLRGTPSHAMAPQGPMRMDLGAV
ncbi:uncharacterized protein G2W53_029916 [Senna tora]|uniref:Uncharacterized protein n=1 Tax=Senna tora TaxID=362788 RepID=A0A834WB68_9FABA|nr:uncharacterized protein G2W53_029916 [Senna tora]